MTDRKVYILMYSGIQNPEKELTDEEVAEIQKLISELPEWEIDPPHFGLGFSGYGAIIANEDGTYIGVMSNIFGQAQVWNNVEQKWVGKLDTSCIGAYLCKLMTPVMAQHYLDAQNLHFTP